MPNVEQRLSEYTLAEIESKIFELESTLHSLQKLRDVMREKSATTVWMRNPPSMSSLEKSSKRVRKNAEDCTQAFIAERPFKESSVSERSKAARSESRTKQVIAGAKKSVKTSRSTKGKK